MTDSRFTQARTLAILRELGWTPGGIVDIGVATGTPGLYDVWPGTPFCLIEPSQESAPHMAAIAARYPNVTVFNVGASDHDGAIVGHQAPGAINVMFDRGRGFPASSFPVRTCDGMVAEAGLKGPLLYKLDTDSHEREILAGSSKTLAQSEVCLIEANIFHELRGCMSPFEIIAHLDALGFALFDVGDVTFGRQEILRCLDFVFVRRETGLMQRALERSKKWAKKLQERRESADRALAAGTAKL